MGATLRFACGCSFRLEAVPGEFEERIKRDGYEGREFRKPPRFARRRRGSSFFRKGARRLGRLSTGRAAFARLERNRSERDKLGEAGRKFGGDESGDFAESAELAFFESIRSGTRERGTRIVLATSASRASSVFNRRKANYVAFRFQVDVASAADAVAFDAWQDNAPDARLRRRKTR